MKTSILTFLALSFLWLGASQNTKIDNAVELTKQFFAENKKIQTLTFTLNKRERIKGNMEEQRSHVKFNHKPLKVYMKQEKPQKGLEVLFVENSNQNKILINPNGFPWVSLSLEPTNPKVRQNQHHTIYESGFDYLADIVENLLNKHKTTIGQHTKLDGTVVWDNRECHKVVIFNPHFKYIDYTVKSGENLHHIAKANKIGAYMILEKNPTLKDYDEVKAGQKIKIPSDYALKLILYLDKKTMLPLMIKVYDDLGLYEEYAYSNMRLNPRIEAEEFSRNYTDYKF
jgi:outer membrane lipoprotein-sorting protein